MNLTIEQFNKLVTKDEFNGLREEIKKIDNDIKKILKLLIECQ